MKESVPGAMCPVELDKAAEALFAHELAARAALARKPAYVLNKASWVLHRTFVDPDPRLAGKTLCGSHYLSWRCGHDKFNSIPQEFPHSVCNRCCKTAPVAAEESSSEDSPTG